MPYESIQEEPKKNNENEKPSPSPLRQGMGLFGKTLAVGGLVAAAGLSAAKAFQEKNAPGNEAKDKAVPAKHVENYQVQIEKEMEEDIANYIPLSTDSSLIADQKIGRAFQEHEEQMRKYGTSKYFIERLENAIKHQKKKNAASVRPELSTAFQAWKEKSDKENARKEATIISVDTRKAK